MNNKNSQNGLFEDFIKDEKLAGTRIMGILGSVLYLVFIIVDLFSLSTTLEEVLFIRGAVVAFLLSSVLLSYTYKALILKYYNVIYSLVFLVAAGGIEAMIYLSQPGDHAAQVYFVGLLLVIMTLFSWSFFKTSVSFGITFIIIASYTFLELQKGINKEALFVNVVFIVSGSTISFIAQFIRNRYLKENFLLQQSLKESIEAKTIEARDNAYLANHDPLTDLPNRRYVTELLEKSLEVAKQNEKILAILYLDLNGFKQVNDIYGHTVGDEVLIIVAKRLELAVRQGDYLSRLGGDEFLAGLMMERESLSDIRKMAAKFTAIISQPMNIDGIQIKIGVSIGIAAYPMHGNNVSVLMDIADKKMYKVKHGLRKLMQSREEDVLESVVIFPGNTKSK